MKKAGIITFHRAVNYGAVLQGYALQQTLLKFDVEAEFIDYVCDIYDHYNIELSGNTLIKLIKKVLLVNVSKKKKRFEFFIKDYCGVSRCTYNRANIGKVVEDEQYDIYITGSDQVWSPDIVGKDGTFFLDFLTERKSISYAASIGIEKVPKEYEDFFREKVTGLSSISVRENSACKELQRLGLNNIYQVCDPVFLLSKDEWNLIIKKVHLPSKYVLIFDFSADEMLWDAAKQYAEKTGAVICYIDEEFFPSTKAKKMSGQGPQEWLYIISHAECIFTNSFHALAFSIIFEKDFWTTAPGDGTNSRLHELLEILKLEKREINFSSLINVEQKIDYGQNKDRLVSYIESSKEFLNCAVNGKENTELEKFLEIDVREEKCIRKSEECTGCTACKIICPANAIQMIRTPRGSSFPYVDKDKCINCGLCSQVCSIENQPKSLEYKQEYYAARSKEPEDWKNSSSGAIFWLLAKKVINKQGVVYGVAYDVNRNVVYNRADNILEAAKSRGTKYVESVKGNIFKEVRNDLEAGKKVLFTGTPCTIDGLYRCLPDKLKMNLYTMDIICHGTPVPIIFEDYQKFMEKKYHSNITYFNFREKEYDKRLNTFKSTKKVCIEFKNSKVYEGTEDVDPYYALFWSNNILRESCYLCRYSNMDRCGDITIGDYWGDTSVNPDFFRTKTESSCLINSPKGKKLFDEIQCDLDWIEVRREDIMQRNLYTSTLKNRKWNSFWRDYYTKSFKYLLIRYADYWGVFRWIGKLVKR